jgi:hypothetical protein
LDEGDLWKLIILNVYGKQQVYRRNNKPLSKIELQRPGNSLLNKERVGGQVQREADLVPINQKYHFKVE